jgi:hypothetical protein
VLLLLPLLLLLLLLLPLLLLLLLLLRAVRMVTSPVCRRSCWPASNLQVAHHSRAQ